MTLIQKLEAVEAKCAALKLALHRVIPMVLECKHENFSDLSGNEDTRTDALKHAVDTLKSTTAGDDLLAQLAEARSFFEFLKRTAPATYQMWERDFAAISQTESYKGKA